MLEAMNTEGIDAAVVFRTTTAHVTGLDDMDPRLADAICRTFNNWLREFCNTDKQRLIPTAQLALHDVDLAVKEAGRAVREHGAAALVLPSNPVKGRPFYDRYYDPLWAVAQDLNVPVAFHGIQLAYQEHLGNRYRDNFALVHSVAHPVELQLALGAMLMGGVFERFPQLRAAFLEGHCSWVPSWLYVLDERWEKFGNKARFGLKLLPSEYFKRQCYVSVDPDEELVVPTVEAIGNDNIVISSDWPHSDSAYPQAINMFLGIKGLSDESRRKILWDNCAHLYSLN
jgi:predicted TIM-barrel fold metal-dependent hydrolase